MKTSLNESEQLKELLNRGVEEIIDRGHLEQALRSGKKLRVKLGIDPTSPNIHIGRAVVLWKLRQFQELGHKVIFIVGDFTGLIGDTSDKDAERPMLSEAQVKANLKTYFKQAFKILDPKKTEAVYNSKWLKKLGFVEIGKLAELFGLHEFEARENISKRLEAGKRVSLRELLYPIMQGYDSVAVKADVELGGIDQRFNLLAGRTIQKFYGQQPQDILTTGLLEGTDGRKMSSSWGNTINLTDEPNDMYGKLMSIPDNLIEKYFTFCAWETPLDEIKKVLKDKSPYDQKKLLAITVTKLYHGESAAVKAGEYFTKVFTNKELPSESDRPPFEIKDGSYLISELLVSSGLVASKSEARRMFEQRGVKKDGQTINDQLIEVSKNQPIVLQVGKRKFLTII